MSENRDVILYLGAGQGRDLAGVLAQPARRIVLVEPNSDCLPVLKEFAADDDRIEILSLAVAGKTGKAPFYACNFADLSSLHRPTRLSELFPGLRVEETREVETLSMERVLQRVAPEPEGSNLLIVDATADAQTVVEGLEQADDPSLFETVILRGAAESLYEDSQPLGVLAERLQSIGYSALSETTEDPDFPEYRLQISPQALELKRLRSLLEDAEQRASRAEELSEQLDAAQKQLAATSEEASGAAASAAKLQAVQSQQLDQMQQLEKAEEAARINAQEARQRENIANDNLAVALRSQAMMQADLEDLRRRHQEVLKIKGEQQSLLEALKPRLQEAARYLQLQQSEATGSQPEMLHPTPNTAGAKKSSRKKTARKAD